MTQHFIPAIHPPTPTAQPTWYFAFSKRRMLVLANGRSTELPNASDLRNMGLEIDRSLYLGRYGDQHCYALDLPEALEPPRSTALVPLRDLYGHFPEDVFALCGRAVQIIEWDQTHQYCSRCGTPTRTSAEERAKQCPKCGHVAFPLLAPAVIVLVENGEQVLLARSPRFPPGMYSVLAGFVEPGESLEQTVAREISEEVSIKVKDLKYFGSQPWPFPHSLMLAFTATYAGGEIKIDDIEIEDANWYRSDQLPKIPSPG